MEQLLNRRGFVEGCASTALLASILEACSEPAGEERAQCSASAVACRPPSTEDEETFVAIADTVVPGCATDPRGEPGAVEGCVLNLASDPRLPVAGFVTVLVALANDYARGRFQRRFVDLDLAERTEVLAQAEGDLPVLSFAFRFFRAAHYAGLYNELGQRSLGYPGGNLGYIHDPDFSLNRAVCRELTADGNMP